MNQEAVVNAVVTEIRKIREEKGFSQRFLAERTGLSQAGIAHMELGDTTPTLLFLLTVADALEVELHGIVGEILRGEAEG
ncbi:MAG: helix-turn-helix transcriptional regulator [Akkermansiaceae bacterium]